MNTEVTTKVDALRSSGDFRDETEFFCLGCQEWRAKKHFNFQFKLTKAGEERIYRHWRCHRCVHAGLGRKIPMSAEQRAANRMRWYERNVGRHLFCLVLVHPVLGHELFNGITDAAKHFNFLPANKFRRRIFSNKGFNGWKIEHYYVYHKGFANPVI